MCRIYFKDNAMYIASTIKSGKGIRMLQRIMMLILMCLPLAAESRLVKENFNGGKIETAGALLRGEGLADDDRGGKCMSGGMLAYFPMSKYWNPKQGTVEFRIKLLAPSTDPAVDNWAMFRATAPIAGISEKDSFAHSFSVINGWGAGLFLLVSDKAGVRQMIKYTKITAWQTNEWHHIAFTWKIDNPGRSSIAFYVDGSPAGIVKDVAIEQDDDAWKAVMAVEPTDIQAHDRYSVRVGSVYTKKHAGCIDDVKIYDFPRSYAQQK